MPRRKKEQTPEERSRKAGLKSPRQGAGVAQIGGRRNHPRRPSLRRPNSARRNGHRNGRSCLAPYTSSHHHRSTFTPHVLAWALVAFRQRFGTITSNR